MKYYIYISDAKVNMLLPQIPHEVKKKVSTELGFDLKVLKASRKSEAESEESRISRLETVVEFIKTYGKVGSIDKPDDYIYDVQPVFSDLIGRVAYFGGRTKTTAFGLSGSTEYLIGPNIGDQRDMRHASNLVGIMKYLKAKGDPDMRRAEDDADNAAYIISIEDIWGTVMQLEAGTRKLQRLEFFAKKLFFEPLPRNRAHKFPSKLLFATPLYISMTD